MTNGDTEGATKCKPNGEAMTKSEARKPCGCHDFALRISGFVIFSSFGFRHSDSGVFT